LSQVPIPKLTPSTSFFYPFRFAPLSHYYASRSRTSPLLLWHCLANRTSTFSHGFGPQVVGKRKSLNSSEFLQKDMSVSSYLRGG
jgi:hypothetical protein